MMNWFTQAIAWDLQRYQNNSYQSEFQLHDMSPYTVITLVKQSVVRNVSGFSTAGILGLNFSQGMDTQCPLLHMYRPSAQPSKQSNTKSLEDSAFKINS
jgi:hypothetical protein